MDGDSKGAQGLSVDAFNVTWPADQICGVIRYGYGWRVSYIRHGLRSVSVGCHENLIEITVNLIHIVVLIHLI